MSSNKKWTSGCLVILVVLFICGVSSLLIPDSSENVDGSPESGEISSIAKSSTIPSTIVPSSTPEPSLTPVPPPTVVELPLQIKSNNGWILTVDSIEQFPSIDTETKRYRPENGIFVVFVGTLGNFSDEDACLTGDAINMVGSNGEQYEMNFELLDELKAKYKRDYPGSFLGQCLDYDATAETFLVFDVPKQSTLSLKIGDTDAYIGQVEAYEQEMVLETPTLLPELTPVTDRGPQSTATISQPDKTDAIVARAVLNTNANLRAGPGTEYEVINSGKVGDTYPVYARSSDGWLLLDAGGETWVALSLTILDSELGLIPIWDGNPIETNDIVVAPVIVSGLGVSRNDFYEVFVSPSDLFEFDSPSELTNGMPRVLGSSYNDSAMIELIGPPNDLYQVSLITIVSTETNKAFELGVITVAFIKTAIPSWDGAVDWFTENIDKSVNSDVVSTVHDGKVLELRALRELGMIMYSIRVEGYGD